MTPARILEARRGAYWLAEGWRVFRAAPLGWFVAAFLYMLFTHFTALLPVIGFGAVLLVPVFTVGLFAIARAVSRGGPVDMTLLFSGFRSALRPQLMLGAVYVAGTLLVVAAMRLADDEGVLQAVLSGERKEPVELTELIRPLGAFALVYAPLTMMFWYAPPLVAWHATGVVKALFFSFVACLMNWRAFLAYGAAVAGIMVVFALAATVIGASGARSLTGMLAFAFVTVLMPTLLASFYASYRDVFESEPAAGA